MESLLAMPIRPLEIMLGKIAPYILIGFLQAALIMLFAVFLFHVPVEGSVLLLAMLSTLFIATNLSIGYTFSTIAQNQLQAIQMSFMFFLPNILLSGFMFPFAGMPGWAQAIGQAVPATHFLRVIRMVMLKGGDVPDVALECGALLIILVVISAAAMHRYRQTLEAAGLLLSGQSPDGRLVEIVELKDHPWFVASQFHPEFRSRPERPHPLFDGFVAASLAVRDGREPIFGTRISASTAVPIQIDAVESVPSA